MKVGTIIRNNWTTTENPCHISIYIGNNKSLCFPKGQFHICNWGKGFQSRITHEGKLAFEPIGFCDFKSVIKKSYEEYMETERKRENGTN